MSFPEKGSLTGFSGADMSLIYEGREVAEIQAMTWAPSEHKCLGYEGYILPRLFNCTREELTGFYPMDIKIRLMREDGEIKTYYFKDPKLPGLDLEKSTPFSFSRIQQ